MSLLNCTPKKCNLETRKVIDYFLFSHIKHLFASCLPLFSSLFVFDVCSLIRAQQKKQTLGGDWEIQIFLAGILSQSDWSLVILPIRGLKPNGQLSIHTQPLVFILSDLYKLKGLQQSCQVLYVPNQIKLFGNSSSRSCSNCTYDQLLSHSVVKKTQTIPGTAEIMNSCHTTSPSKTSLY